MKIVCLIDSLGSGGAQRQMVALVGALVGQDHEVRLLTYHKNFNHFFADVRAVDVEPEYVSATSKISRMWNIRHAIRKNRPDCIISFLNTPNLIGVLSSLPPHRIPIVVSERSLDTQGKTLSNWIRFQAFRMADRVVTNSQAQAKFIHESYPFLKKRTVVIRNSVDLDKFRPALEPPRNVAKRLLVAASVIPVKNALRFIHAVKIANSQLTSPLYIDWYGNKLLDSNKPNDPKNYYVQADSLVKELGLQQVFRFHDPVDDIEVRFSQYDAVCLPSLYEGCPNVVCEGMASGMPVLASDVSDLHDLFPSCRFLFDPLSAEDMARKLIEFQHCTSLETDAIRTQNREIAETFFSPQVFANTFNELLLDVVASNAELV